MFLLSCGSSEVRFLTFYEKPGICIFTVAIQLQYLKISLCVCGGGGGGRGGGLPSWSLISYFGH